MSTLIANGGSTEDTTPFIVSAPQKALKTGQVLVLYRDDVEIASGPLDSNQQFTYSEPVALLPATYQYKAAIRTGPTTGTKSAPYTIIVVVNTPPLLEGCSNLVLFDTFDGVAGTLINGAAPTVGFNGVVWDAIGAQLTGSGSVTTPDAALYTYIQSTASDAELTTGADYSFEAKFTVGDTVNNGINWQVEIGCQQSRPGSAYYTIEIHSSPDDGSALFTWLRAKDSSNVQYISSSVNIGQGDGGTFPGMQPFTQYTLKGYVTRTKQRFTVEELGIVFDQTYDITNSPSKLNTVFLNQVVPHNMTLDEVWVCGDTPVIPPNLFVAVANSGGATAGQYVATSPDGITWTLRDAAADTYNGSYWSVTWASELQLFCAVARSNSLHASVPDLQAQIITSPNGINWTVRTSAAHLDWFTDVTWNGSLFVAVGVGDQSSGTTFNIAQVMTSPDGINWTARTSASTNDWQSVCWAEELGLFVAVANSGSGNRVMTSPDGITWTSRTTPADNNWLSVVWNGTIFVAVSNTGTGNRVMTSADGVTWTSRTSAADNGWTAVEWAQELGLFCAVGATGTSNRVMTSPDGITWTLRTSAADEAWVGLCWNGTTFVAVSNWTGTGTNHTMRSTDGITWTADVSAGNKSWRAVVWGG